MSKRDVVKDLELAADNVKSLEPRYVAELIRSARDEIVKLRAFADVIEAAAGAAQKLRDKP